MYYIYGLVDPTSREIKYIGRTNNPKRRLSDHRGMGSRSWKKPKSLDVVHDVCGWVSYVRHKLKKKIGLVILQTVENEDTANLAEAWWVKTMIEKGNKIYNIGCLKKFLSGKSVTRRKIIKCKDLCARLDKIGTPRNESAILLKISAIDLCSDKPASHSQKIAVSYFENYAEQDDIDTAIEKYKKDFSRRLQ